MNAKYAEKLKNEYIETVEKIIGTFHDAINGFRLTLQQVINAQSHLMASNDVESTNVNSIADLDDRPFTYRTGERGTPGNLVLHRTTQANIKQRNFKDGSNSVFMGQVCLIAIFQYWEDYYRGEIAKAIGIEKNDLKSDIFGDLRLIRNSIVHHRGIAKKETEGCKILNKFNKGESIIITDSDMHLIAQSISGSLNDIIKRESKHT